MPESTDIVDIDTAVEVSLDVDHLPNLPRIITAAPQIDESEMDAVRSTHVRFKYSRPGPESGLSSIEGLIPIHLYPRIPFERVRGDYPAFFPADGGQAKSLTAIIDELTERSDTEGDERHYFQRSVLRLESAMRKLVDADGEFELSSLWNAALEQLEARLSPSEREVVLAHLKDARASLNMSGSVVPFGGGAALALLRRTSQQNTSEHTRRLRDELERLIQDTRALLEVDQSERPDAHSPDVLEQSVGESFSDELNFEALSSLMDEGPHGALLSDDRRSRIESVLAVLSDQLSELSGTSPDDEHVQTVTSAGELADLTEAHRQRCLELVKAVQIARLETSDQYDEEHHGAQFEAFGVDQLSTEDLFSMPAPPVVVRGGDIDGVERLLQNYLDGNGPHKVVLVVESPLSEDAGVGFATPVGTRLLAGGRPASAVYQVSVSNLAAVTEAFHDALAYRGFAVVCVYVGSEYGSEAFHPYFRSAAVGDSRIIPSFSNNPERGPAWADRFSIGRNIEPGESWPASTVRYLDAGEVEIEENLPFMPADVMAMDDRFAGAFRQIPQAHWHDDLVPLHDYLKGDYGDASVPFILMVGADGLLVRVICSQRVIESTKQIGDRWHALQELGGIGNSHVERQLQLETVRMEDETRIRVEEAETELRAQLEQKTGVLAEQIVANIASGLLGGDLTTAPASVQPRAVAVAPAQTETPGAGTAAEAAGAPVPQGDSSPHEEEDDDLSFDEAYIETPRCTTCDECTTINPRLFAYNENKQAYIADVTAGTFREMVLSAEKCPVKIIHTGKPLNPDEPHLDELIARAEAFQ